MESPWKALTKLSVMHKKMHSPTAVALRSSLSSASEQIGAGPKAGSGAGSRVGSGPGSRGVPEGFWEAHRGARPLLLVWRARPSRRPKTVGPTPRATTVGPQPLGPRRRAPTKGPEYVTQSRNCKALFRVGSQLLGPCCVTNSRTCTVCARSVQRIVSRCHLPRPGHLKAPRVELVREGRWSNQRVTGTP